MHFYDDSEGYQGPHLQYRTIRQICLQQIKHHVPPKTGMFMYVCMQTFMDTSSESFSLPTNYGFVPTPKNCFPFMTNVLLNSDIIYNATWLFRLFRLT